MSNDQTSGCPVSIPVGCIMVDEDNSQVRVGLNLQDRWFPLPWLRAFAAYLVTVADGNEPSPEVDELTQLLETALAVTQGPRATARFLHQSGYRLERAAEAG